MMLSIGTLKIFIYF